MKLAVEVELVLEGDSYVLRMPPLRIPSKKLNSTSTVPDLHLRELTKRQQEVLYLIEQGKCDKEIATKLGIAVRTAKYHVSNVLIIYKVSNRIELLVMRNRERERPPSKSEK